MKHCTDFRKNKPLSTHETWTKRTGAIPTKTLQKPVNAPHGGARFGYNPKHLTEEKILRVYSRKGEKSKVVAYDEDLAISTVNNIWRRGTRKYKQILDKHFPAEKEMCGQRFLDTGKP